ncbi:50S ribosomal protein L23 [Ichthyobacterium seriolicida]|uniref:Large ribosomal subunit protein uL23 n=1 Tax=Ichthyobacterium seriolicida TaxID=242600 RepID=A0A1J1DY44_9FLAO|nr:50S ribosomal protein L23 [Ichthyobacterium seriolicida]BAV94810.1 50S ribosomal protein L23 [Ichthyobacterium seriolicida]
MNRIIQRAVVTEKANSLSERENKYTFLVDPNANKIQVKLSVENFYNVPVKKVRLMNCSTKAKVKNTKSGVIRSKSKVFKKAIVEVSEGKSIDFYSSI